MERDRSIHNTLNYIRNLEVHGDELYAIFALAVWKMKAYKDENGGRLPKGLFLKSIESSGSYPCAEVLLISPDNNPILKFRKDETARAGEQIWENRLHIPGLSVGNTRAEDILTRLLEKEVVEDPSNSQNLLNKSKLIGFGRLDEPERKTIADTSYYEIRLTGDDLKLLKKDFFEVDGYRLANGVIVDGKTAHVIDQHKPVLKWWRQGENRYPVFDTRPNK